MDPKQTDFFCPYCREMLSMSGKIVLNTRRAGNELGKMQLSVAVGDYGYEHIPEVEFLKGEIVDFFCPHCKEDLSSDHYENFARLLLRSDNKAELELLFSREAGKRKTYIITEDGIESYSGR